VRSVTARQRRSRPGDQVHSSRAAEPKSSSTRSAHHPFRRPVASAWAPRAGLLQILPTGGREQASFA